MNPWADNRRKPWYVRGWEGVKSLLAYHDFREFAVSSALLALFFLFAYFALVILTAQPY
jgi:hypothetical protein